MVDLTGKKAIVCGSTQGIGRASAEALARQGATVTLVARDASALREVAAGLDSRAGQTHSTLCADFGEPQRVRSAVADHVKEKGAHQIVINNTGGPPGGNAIDADAAAFERAFSMHLICNQLLVQTLVPGMRQSGYGRIINIISTSVREPIPGLGVSNTVRGAVASWAKTLSRELARFGITVNNVLPGYTLTGRLRSIIATRAEKEGISTIDVEKRMISQVPAGRFAGAEEIAAVVAFLASSDASYVNGVSLAVDGGRTNCI